MFFKFIRNQDEYKEHISQNSADLFETRFFLDLIRNPLCSSCQVRHSCILTHAAQSLSCIWHL